VCPSSRAGQDQDPKGAATVESPLLRKKRARNWAPGQPKVKSRGRGPLRLRSGQVRATRSPLNRSPLEKMDYKQNYGRSQRQQQSGAQASGGMGDHADHPRNDRRPDRRERKHDRANFASGYSEALRETGHGDRIQSCETQAGNQRAANHSGERWSPEHQADACRSRSVAGAQDAAFRKVTQKNGAEGPADRQRCPEKCGHQGGYRSAARSEARNVGADPSADRRFRSGI
jgi:hypothetical protein